MKRWIKLLLVVLGTLLVLGQALPFPPADNPPVDAEVPAPPEVRAVLRAACYDCHSNETVWPWYSGIIPAKWLVRNHVREGRKHLNFSTWNRYPAETRSDLLEQVVEQVETGQMPLRSYLLLHGDARLSSEARSLLLAWARGGGGGGEGSRSEEVARDGEGPRSFP